MALYRVNPNKIKKVLDGYVAARTKKYTANHKEYAIEIGIAPDTLSRLLNGAAVRRASIQQFCEATGVSQEDLGTSEVLSKKVENSIDSNEKTSQIADFESIFQDAQNLLGMPFIDLDGYKVVKMKDETFDSFASILATLKKIRPDKYNDDSAFRQHSKGHFWDVREESIESLFAGVNDGNSPSTPLSTLICVSYGMGILPSALLINGSREREILKDVERRILCS